MAAWKDEKKSTTLERLKKSLDMVYIRKQLIVLALVAVFVGLFCWFQAATGGENEAVAGKTVWWLSVAVLVPFVLYYLWRIRKIFHKAEAYQFCRAELNQCHYHYIRRNMYFRVLLEDVDGKKFLTDTRAIFQTYGLSLVLEDYMGATVTIGYNEETEEVVVIG